MTGNDEVGNRRRSFSAPQRYDGDAQAAPELSRQRTTDTSRMPAIREGETEAQSSDVSHLQVPSSAGQPRSGTTPSTASISEEKVEEPFPELEEEESPAPKPSGFSLKRFRTNSSAVRNTPNQRTSVPDPAAEEYSSDVIDLLDLVDPEVRTMSTLTNLQNSLFIPDLGRLVDRRPAYDLTRRTTESRPQTAKPDRLTRQRTDTRASQQEPPTFLMTPPSQEQPDVEGEATEQQIKRTESKMSISSELSESRYAVLPHGVSLEGWSKEDVAELNDHVRHLLHSRREGFKRGMRGFRQYISRPLGLFVFLYAVLVTLFGAAWVFCLIGWIYVGSRQDYFINVIDNILVALFALMGDGLAPFRAVDTYHMCFIAKYHHLTWQLREKKKLPDLADANDLPSRRASAGTLQDAIDREEMAQFSVLTTVQQKRLQYHQAKFNKSHTFYKPHETSTHHAFPLRLLVAVVVLLDCHSLFQIALGTCTWSINYEDRPEALTATILSCSITCNIVAGVLISVGDHKTRKKDVLERIHRQEITEEALKRMAKTHNRGEIGLSVNPDAVESEEIKDALRGATGGNSPATARPSSSREREFNVEKYPGV